MLRLLAEAFTTEVSATYSHSRAFRFSGCRPRNAAIAIIGPSVPKTASNSLSRSLQAAVSPTLSRSEEHTSELQSLRHLVCRLLLDNDTAATEIYTLSLHDALPISIIGPSVPKTASNSLSRSLQAAVSPTLS